MSWSFLESLIGGSLGSAGERAGTGIFEAMLRGIAGLFQSGGAEGAFARLMSGGGAAQLLDLAIDAQILNDLYNLRKNTQQGMPYAEKEAVGHVKDAVKSHALLRQQLEAHKHEKGVALLLEKYIASGVHLPDDDIVKSAYRKLSMLFHPDRTGNNKEKEEFFKRVKDACETLEKPEVRAAYAEAIHQSPDTIAKLYEKLSGMDWQKINETSVERLRLNGPEGVRRATARAQQWASELNGAQKTGLVFAVVGAVALGAYATAKIVDNHRKKKRQKNTGDENPALHAQRVRESNTGITSGLG
jgi:DnaJ domain